MIIEITGPVFKCSEDENIFFERLYELPGYESLSGEGGDLYLTFKGPLEKSTLREVQEICDYWNTTYSIVDNES